MGEDLATHAFLAFLDQQMDRHPESIQPLDARLIAEMDELVGDLAVDLNEDPGPEASLSRPA